MKNGVQFMAEDDNLISSQITGSIDMTYEIRIRKGSRKGDAESIAMIHARVYGEEYGYDRDFLYYVERTLEELPDGKNPREEIWIVENAHSVWGSVAVLERPGNAAQIRWLILAPEIRGQGLGKELFGRAVEFIKRRGYESAFLTTQSILEQSASIYRSFGFKIVEERKTDC